MAAGDLTVIRDSRTGSHKGDERGCRRDEKVTRNDDKKLQPRLKVTVGNLDGGQWQIAPVLSLNSSPPLKNPPKRPFRSSFYLPKEEGKFTVARPHKRDGWICDPFVSVTVFVLLCNQWVCLFSRAAAALDDCAHMDFGITVMR